VTWTQVGSTKAVTMASTVSVGLFVTSHNAGALSTATFDNVKVTQTGTSVSTPPVAQNQSISTSKDTQVNTTLRR